MATKNIAHRRKVRALEAMRDKLAEQAAKTKLKQASIRAELKTQRRAK